MINLKVNLCGITIDNPIIPASGIFGYGYEFADYYDINCLGTFSFKGTTREARFGNPQPRIAEYDYGVLNATGLENPGVDAVIAEELPLLKKVFHKPVMANISGFSVDEYVEVAEKMSAEKQVGWLEVNISCPNVHGGGMAYGTDPKAAAEVTAAVRKVTKKPIILKLSPNVTDITEIAKACEDAGADGLSLINTVMGMRIDLHRRAPLLANTTGGMSGPGIFPLALRMVWQVYKAVRIPIVGVGGINNARGVIEMMMAGATAVQVGAANLVDPYVCPNIIKELPAVMKGLRINDINEIIGAAHGSDMHHAGNIAHGN
ncbi:MAG: dihydroorotate dehydrogenase [Lachnospiraceae bacterium]|nr:dihydroorotate dehydrogenase [Lachnospiraceae bacterium]